MGYCFLHGKHLCRLPSMLLWGRKYCRAVTIYRTFQLISGFSPIVFPNFQYLITLKSKAGKGFCWADSPTSKENNFSTYSTHFTTPTNLLKCFPFLVCFLFLCISKVISIITFFSSGLSVVK